MAYLNIIIFGLIAYATMVANGEGVCTAGWENINPERREFPPVKVIWETPTSGFRIERLDGAEGEVRFVDDKIIVSKQNNKGSIIVYAPPFKVEKGRTLRFFVDVSSFSLKPMKAEGWLAAFGEKPQTWFSDKESQKWLVGGGLTMVHLINSAPGMTYRKYTHFTADGDTITPLINVSGAASESTWSGWKAEDLVSSQPIWDKHYDAIASPDRRGEMLDRDSFDCALAKDIDHFAEVKSVNGRSALFLDGVEIPPVVYKAPGCEWDIKGRITYSGKPLQRAGIKLGVANLRLGKLPSMDGPWSESGFDVTSAVEIVRNEMRVGDKSCFVLAIGTSAYPKFSEEHPDETWRNEDGSVVRGNSGSAIPDIYNDGGKPDPGDARWPWMSYCSPAWRTAVKRNVEILIAELRRQGLLKRIVGVHFYGYHDGQFAVPIPDCSICAKTEHAKFLAKHGLKAGDPGADYAYFMKQIGFLALEDFSRAAKRAIGKPIVAFRWCMSPFSNEGGSYDIGTFLESDAVDVIVPQPTYPQRLPGLSQGVRLPCQSLHLHGKLMMYEFDLRTWAALDGWAHSVVETKGLGQADDLAMWQTIFRKHAGIMVAQRMGWWFYDMAGGWFHPEPIVNDVDSVMRTLQEITRVKPNSWHPDAAIVVDELSMSLYNRKGYPKVKDAVSIVMGEWPKVSTSGVPYDFLHINDLLANPELAKRYRAIALCGFLYPDVARKELMKKLTAFGVKTFVVQPGGYAPEFFHDFVRNAGGYVAVKPGVMQLDMNGNFISVHCIVPGRYDFKLPFPAKVMNLKSGLLESTSDKMFSLSLSAGETCWFRLEQISQ